MTACHKTLNIRNPIPTSFFVLAVASHPLYLSNRGVEILYGVILANKPRGDLQGKILIAHAQSGKSGPKTIALTYLFKDNAYQWGWRVTNNCHREQILV